MSTANNAKKSSSGGVSLSFIVGSVVAWCTNPTFVGLSGFGKSLLVGVGTSVGSSLGMLAGILGGAVGGGIVGGLLGKVLGRKNSRAGTKGAIMGAIIGGFAGGAVGGVGGAVKGYQVTEGWLVEKTAPAFNKAATKAVDTTKTLVLEPKAFTAPKPAY